MTRSFRAHDDGPRAVQEFAVVTVLFRSRLRDPESPDYLTLADRMCQLASEQPGFVSFRAYAAEDGERIAISQFERLEDARAWGRHPEHLEAQRRGKEEFYSEFHLEIAETLETRSA